MPSLQDVREQVAALMAAGAGADALAVVRRELAKGWTKPLFALEAQLAREHESAADFQRYLVGEIRARPDNLHAIGVLIDLRLAEPLAEEGLRLVEETAADGPARAILTVWRASLHLLREERGRAWVDAVAGLDGIRQPALRQAVARMIAARFDWHGHGRDAETLLLRGRRPDEVLDALSDLAGMRGVSRVDDGMRALFGFTTTSQNPQRRTIALQHLDWRWRVDGPSLALVEESADWERFFDAGDVRLRGERIAMAREIGADDLARRLLDEEPEVAAAFRANLPVAAMLRDHAGGAETSAALALHAGLYDDLGANQARLAALLGDPAARIAVVGNSGIEEGRGRGPAIDGHDLVVRFNRIDLSAPFVADYGARTDVHLLHIRGADPAYRPSPDARYVAYVFPHARHRFRHWQAVQGHRSMGKLVAAVPDEGYSELVARLRAPASAGLRFLAWLHRLRGPLDPASLFGFAFTDQIARGGSSHYFELRRPSMHHNWAKEAQIFQSLLAG